jgi:hypothetical protein
MGFDAFFLWRIDYQDFALRNTSRPPQLEFMWQGSQSLPKEAIWTHVMLNDGYCMIGGFFFEWTDPPIMADPALFDYNIDQRAALFVQNISQRIVSFNHNHLLVPFGCDFMFMNPTIMYKNMDLLMVISLSLSLTALDFCEFRCAILIPFQDYINRRPEFGMRMFYSTPSLYYESVKALNLSWTTKTDDFFPYCPVRIPLADLLHQTDAFS